MASLETQTEIVSQRDNNNEIVSEHLTLSTPRSIKTVRSLESARSLKSIHSLRDIPLVSTSFDGAFDSILGDKSSNAQSSHSTGPQLEYNHSTLDDFPSLIQAVAAGTSSPRSTNGDKSLQWVSSTSRQKKEPSDADVDLEQYFFDASEIAAGRTRVTGDNTPEFDSLENTDSSGNQADSNSGRDFSEADNDVSGNPHFTGSNKANSRHIPDPSSRDESITMSSHDNLMARLTSNSTNVEIDQQASMDEIGKCAGASASMRDYIDTWAPTAHFVVTAAAALQRDSAAFTASLISLLSDNKALDPTAFSTQFYQSREAYSSLSSLGEFSTVTYGQQGWTRASSPRTSKSSQSFKYNHESLATLANNDTWDDRQLVDSLMTLLRTSPGFIASAISQMSTSELKAFCGELEDDCSPSNVIFYGILGSAKRNRPRVLADIVKCLDHCLSCDVETKEKRIRIFCAGIFQRLMSLAVGTMSTSSLAKIDRFFRLCIDGRARSILDVTPLISSIIPEEMNIFCQSIDSSASAHISDFLLGICVESLEQFVHQVFIMPHMYGSIEDVFIGPKVQARLEITASRLIQTIPEYSSRLRHQVRSDNPTEYWLPDELIAVKGSDIVLLYNALSPRRDNDLPKADTEVIQGDRPNSMLSMESRSSRASERSTSDDDEWCLDSIREDLVPVMRGLANSTRTKVDGWQIFKVGADGLVTDLGSDMGLSSADSNEDLNPQVQASCNAVAYYDGDTVSERIEGARKDALLRGDHLAILDSVNAEHLLTSQHVLKMAGSVTHLKSKCKASRRMLDQAAQDQRHERERLSILLTTLDSLRIHVWYETEARNGQPFARAREFLQALYPKTKEEYEAQFGSSLSSNEGFKGSLGFSFGASNGGVATHSGNLIYQHDNSGSLSTDAHTNQIPRSRRLSILGSHSVPESPFLNKSMIAPGKLNDKEVEAVNVYLRRNRCRNIIPAEEKFTRAIVEIATLSKKLVDRDHLISYVSFKRDRHYQTQYAQMQAQIQAGTHRFANSGGSGGANNNSKRNSQHQRRSSLGLFDFFDITNHQSTAPSASHTTTSTQFLGLATSHDSSRNMASGQTHYHSKATHSRETDRSGEDTFFGPPKAPSIAQVQALVLSDIGYRFMSQGTETDLFMQQIGRMLLEGDSQILQPLIDDISVAGSPLNKSRALEQLVEYIYTARQRSQSTKVSRSDVIQELSRFIGREPGTIYRDIQTVSLLVNPQILNQSAAFEDCVEAAGIVLDTVVVRSMDYAARFLRYYMESTTTAAPQMALMGINDSVAIWAFCARQGHREAQEKSAELYLKYPHLQLELRPLVRPSSVVDGVEGASLREAVALHWMTMASRI